MTTDSRSAPPAGRRPGVPRLRIVPTGLGVKGLLMFGVLEVAFLATSYSNLFFLLLLFCGALGIAGFWWTITNVRAVGVGCRVHDADPSGVSVVDLQLATRAGGVAHDVTVALCVGGHEADAAHRVRVEGSVPVRAVLPELPRGVHRATSLAVVSRHPFGLFRARRVHPIDHWIVVPPRPWPDMQASAASAGGDAATAAAARGAGALPEVAGLRPFRAGDAPGDVHWKASARRGEPIVKQRERESGGGDTFVVDRSRPREAFERHLRDAATWLAAVIAGGRTATLRCGSMVVRVAGGPAGAAAAWRWLAEAAPLPPRREEPASALGRPQQVAGASHDA